MSHPLLEPLKEPYFLLKLGVISSEKSMFQNIKKERLVQTIRDEYLNKNISEQEIREIVNWMLEKRLPGYAFPYDYQMAALVVAIGMCQDHLIKEIIEDCQKLDPGEFFWTCKMAKMFTIKEIIT